MCSLAEVPVWAHAWITDETRYAVEESRVSVDNTLWKLAKPGVKEAVGAMMAASEQKQQNRMVVKSCGLWLTTISAGICVS